MKTKLSCRLLRVIPYLLVSWLAFAFLLQPAQAQAPLNVDSLQSLLEHSTDTTRVRLLCQLAYALRAKDTPAAQQYAQEAIDYARQIKFKEGEALAIHRLGITYGFQSDFDKALELLMQSSELAIRLELWGLAGDNTLNLGGVYASRSNTKKAFEYYTQAYTYYEKAGRRAGMASALYGIGNTFSTEKKYDQGLEKYRASIQLFEELHQEKEIPKVLVNIGLLYKEKNDFPLSIENFTRAINLFAAARNQRGRATAYLHRAETYYSLQEREKAKIDLDSSMLLNDRTNHDFNKVKCFLLYGKIFRDEKLFKQAIAELERSLVISKKIKLLEEIGDGYRTLAEVNEAMGDYQRAYENHLLHSVYHDSLFNKEKSRQIQELQIEYETAQKEAEIRELKNQRILNQTYLYGSFVLLTLLALIAFLALNRQRLRIKKDKELGEKEAQILEEKKALLDAESLNRQLTEERLQKELDYKNKELTTYALNLIQKNEVLENIKAAVEEIRTAQDSEVRSKLTGLINTVNYSFHLDKDWENFKVHFEQVHQSFFDKLLQQFPDLNANDMKLCALIKLNLDTKESASILDISPESAKVARHRLRKKLNLAQDQNLAAFLAGF